MPDPVPKNEIDTVSSLTFRDCNQSALAKDLQQADSNITFANALPSSKTSIFSRGKKQNNDRELASCTPPGNKLKCVVELALCTLGYK